MLKIFNTLTRRKEEFKPLIAGKVSLYVCGVTVYDYCHIGHARTYSSMDIIVRYLKFCGYQVTYVRNITDIDDKIIKRAHENNEDVTVLTQRFTQAMHEDFAALRLLPPDQEPLATSFIPQMITLIEKMLTNHHAYIADNKDVYFDVRSFSSYGQLSHHDIEQLESGARVEVSEAKRDPLDFVLWKQAKANEPAWDSPWGKGRPGWHLECSAMSMALLGENFDLHGGGQDLIFPHHENEIAQSQAAFKCQFANTWVHGGFLQIEKEKMSKSLGNIIRIRELLKEHEAEVIRYFLISSHYRSALIYSEEALLQSRQALERLYTALRGLHDYQVEPVSDGKIKQRFIEAMDDDCNTPLALSVLFELAHEIQRLRAKEEQTTAAAYGALLKQLGGILGILQTDPDVFFQSNAATDNAAIEVLIAARQSARQEKNWAEADRLRDVLAEMSILIEDGPNGTTWKKTILKKL